MRSETRKDELKRLGFLPAPYVYELYVYARPFLVLSRQGQRAGASRSVYLSQEHLVVDREVSP